MQLIRCTCAVVLLLFAASAAAGLHYVPTCDNGTRSTSTAIATAPLGSSGFAPTCNPGSAMVWVQMDDGATGVADVVNVLLIIGMVACIAHGYSVGRQR